jgi:hypothetical protein
MSMSTDGISPNIQDHFRVMVPNNLLINYQKNIDAAFSRMQKFKTHKIAALMNKEVYRGSENLEPHSEIGKPWTYWFLSAHVKINNPDNPMSKIIPISQIFQTDSVKQSLATAYLSQLITSTQVELKKNRDTGVEKFSNALASLLRELGQNKHEWVENAVTGVSTIHTDYGISVTFKSILHNRHMPVVADHRFEQYINCHRTTRGFELQPKILEISLDGCAFTLNACVYPRCKTTKIGGLLIGTMCPTNVEPRHPIAATVVESANMTLSRIAQVGIDECDAASVMAGYTCRYRNSLVDVYLACHILRVVCDLKEFKIPPLQDMSAEVVHETHNILHKHMMDSPEDERQIIQIMCKDAFRGMQKLSHPNHGSDGSSDHACLYHIRCTGGTVDCFENDTQYTDMALHTNNFFSATFDVDGQHTHVSGDIPVSMYATYYIGGVPCTPNPKLYTPAQVGDDTAWEGARERYPLLHE